MISGQEVDYLPVIQTRSVLFRFYIFVCRSILLGCPSNPRAVLRLSESDTLLKFQPECFLSQEPLRPHSVALAAVWVLPPSRWSSGRGLLGSEGRCISVRSVPIKASGPNGVPQISLSLSFPLCQHDGLGLYGLEGAFV